MKSLIHAYLDDYDLIKVEIDREFNQGESSSFYLTYDKSFFPLSILDKITFKDRIVYELKPPTSLTIGLDYQLIAVNGYRVPLNYRFVVKTDRFNTEFYYDGDDLGCTVDDKTTSFALWAPTASEVKLEVEYHGQIKVFNMHRTEKGVYRLSFSPRSVGAVYHYLVKVNGQWNDTVDPYGKASIANSTRSVVIDPESYRVRTRVSVPFVDYTDAVIYETSVRDYTWDGTFLAMSNNISYLTELGITHLQLMPVNDFGSVDELHPELYYNWGYDPVQYQCLEGSYSSNPINSGQVLLDFRNLIDRLHGYNIRVNLDMVFNHMYSRLNSPFEKTVPYYYFRYFKDGNISNGSFCGNDVDTSRGMCRKMIVDTLKYYTDIFDIDGFRFDLMGLIDVTTMLTVSRELKNMKPDIMLYGEGWDMQTAIPPEDRASKKNNFVLSSYAFFNDGFRESIKGSTFDVNAIGYGTGNHHLAEAAGKAMQGLLIDRPEQSVNYVECHDDMTCFDKISACCRMEGPSIMIKRQMLMLGMVILAQGIPFIHSGQEYCRSKGGISNSYNKPDSVNKLKPEDKVRYRSVIEYTQKLIALRKKYHINKKREEILKDVSYSIINSRVIYTVRNSRDNTDLTIIFNPFNEAFVYNFEGSKTNLLSDEIITAQLTVEPVSLAVLGVRND